MPLILCNTRKCGHEMEKVYLTPPVVCDWCGAIDDYTILEKETAFEKCTKDIFSGVFDDFFFRCI